MVDWFETGRNCKSPEEVRAAIDLLSDQFKHFDPTFGFAHIPLGENDLSDASINHCLGDKKALVEFINMRMGEIEDWTEADFHSPSADLAELLESVAATINLLKGFLYIPERIRDTEPAASA